MIRSTGLFSTCVLALILSASPAAGQAMVEYGIAAGTAATSTAPARGLKDSLGGMFSTLEKILSTPQPPAPPAPFSATSLSNTTVTPARKTAARTRPATAPLTHAAAPPPRPNYEDPGAIQAGMAYEELLRRFGPPALEFTLGPNRRTMSYVGKDGAVQVEFQGGKVTSAEKPNS